MNDISPLGWIVIAILVVILIATNLSLITLFRSRSKGSINKDPSSTLFESLKNPWEKEDQQWRELSDQVRRLDQKDHPMSESGKPGQKP